MKRIAFALALLVFSFGVLAQYPAKPLRFIVGFPPGGSADPTTRIVAAALSEQLGQPVVVENRPGGDSAIAAEMVSKMAPDGYTIFFGSNSAMTAAVALRRNPGYDPLKDFTPISLVGRATQVLFVHPDVPARTLKEFVDHARASPGKLNYGTGNPLSIVYSVQLMAATGITMVHVPYKGEGPLTPDLVAGRVHMAILSNPSGFSLAKEGRLRALAVLLDNRSPILPDVPTIIEAGVPEVSLRHWAGVYGPPGLSPDVVARLNKEIAAALKKPEVIEKLLIYGYAVETSTPARLLEINRDDLALWRRLVAQAGIALVD